MTVNFGIGVEEMSCARPPSSVVVSRLRYWVCWTVEEELMLKFLISGLGLFLVATLPATAAQAGAVSDTTLFGKDPGDLRAFACFTRHYDEAHLKAHPKQNVTDMTLLVDSTYDYSADEPSRSYALGIQVNFRKVDKPFDVSGSCSSSAGDEPLHCGVDCDGGQIDVRLKDANSILVDIPYGARIYDPSQPLDADPDAGVAPEAHFGPDDTTFLLARTSLKTCLDLLPTEDKDMVLGFSQ